MTKKVEKQNKLKVQRKHCQIFEKLEFLKITAQAFEAGDLPNIFVRFWGFWGSFSYKTFRIKKRLLLTGYI